MTREDWAAKLHLWRQRVPFFTMPAPALQTGQELWVLTGWAANKELPAGHVLEIGAGAGGSAVGFWLGNEERGRGELVISVEPFTEHEREGSVFGGAAIALLLMNLPHQLPGLHVLMGTSDTVRDIAAGARPYRLALIDGDHSYEWVTRDLHNVAAIIQPGGVIALHDTADRRQGSWQFWQEIAGRGFLDLEGVRLAVVEQVETLGILRAESTE